MKLEEARVPTVIAVPRRARQALGLDGFTKLTLSLQKQKIKKLLRHCK